MFGNNMTDCNVKVKTFFSQLNTETQYVVSSGCQCNGVTHQQCFPFQMVSNWSEYESLWYYCHIPLRIVKRSLDILFIVALQLPNDYTKWNERYAT